MVQQYFSRSMAFVVVTCLLGTLEHAKHLLLQPPHSSNFNLPDCDTEIIQSLSHKLRSLQAFLDQSKTSFSDDYMVTYKVLVESEDRIESKLRKIYLAANKGDPIAKACQGLHRTLQKVVKRIESSLGKLITEASSTPSSRRRDGGSSQPENVMIGLEDELQKIKDMLIKQQPDRKLEVISIVGESGAGKTTLAKRAYEDPLVMSHFDIRVWTNASGQYSSKKLLTCILGSFVSLTPDISKKDHDQLVDQLCKTLMGQRYLIVIDDFQSPNTWHDIQRCFPADTYGSRVVITTKNCNVAKCASQGEYTFSTRRLSPDESWNLFCTILSNNGECFLPPALLELIRTGIGNKYRLPIHIVLLGGLLATLRESLEDSDLIKELSQMVNENLIPNIRWFCYKYLPIHLKSCVLHLGTYPKNSDIDVKKLMKLWVAEGFFNSEVNKSLEEVAEDSLHELINRRLVQVSKQSFDGKIKSCMLHGYMHAFCLELAEEEGIVSIEFPDGIVGHLGKMRVILQSNRWISCESCRWPIARTKYASSKIRSILYVGEDFCLAECRFTFPCLRLLRVLDLSSIRYWHSVPSEIVNLVHLRYLAFNTIGSLFNLQLFKVQNLQTLIISSWVKECCLQLPRDILDLPWLRHVRLDKGSSLYLPNVVRENLQTLLWLKISSWDSRTTNFARVPKLKELGIYIEGEVLANDLESLVELHRLEKLKLEMGRVERFNLPTSFPPNLKKLTLKNTCLPWEKMDVIGKLHNLEVLKLKDFAFHGTEWTPASGGFQQLKFFLIVRSDLEHWNANANHFPVLERLALRYCWDLKTLPHDFVKVSTLQLIELDNCYSSLVTSAKEIQQGQRGLGNEALVVRDVTKVELRASDESSKEKSEFTI